MARLLAMAMLLAGLVPVAPAAADEGEPPEEEKAGPAHLLQGGVRPVLLKASPRTLSHPHDVALHPEGLYLLVADIGNDVIQVLDPGKMTIVTSFGGDTLNSPHDVAFGRERKIYVADTANDRIVIYRFKGVLRIEVVVGDDVD